jgi:hypothetical protein
MTITFADGEVFDADQPVRHRRLNPHETRAAHGYFVSTHFDSNRVQPAPCAMKTFCCALTPIKEQLTFRDAYARINSRGALVRRI